MFRTPPWGTYEVPDNDDLTLAVGPLTLRLRRAEGELRAVITRAGEAPHQARRIRWAADDVAQVALSPHFPDRPLVVEPEDPFWLLRGAQARIYVRVPVWVGLDGLGTLRHELLRLPTRVASDTWWGTLEEGELCYWLSTRARRVLAEADVEPHLVICPLQLVNRSHDDLHVDKIALRVAYLSLYGAGEGLWADETRVVYTGDAEGSRLDMAGTAPSEVPGAALISPPARHMARGFRARTFRRLRSITELFG